MKVRKPKNVKRELKTESREPRIEKAASIFGSRFAVHSELAGGKTAEPFQSRN
jgi:hypothetical protein